MIASSNVRAYFFLAEVFKNRQSDPFCRKCKAFVNSVHNARESLARFESEQTIEVNSLPPDFQQFLTEAKKVISSLSLPGNATGQKREGNCKLPQGVCFVKASLAVLQNLEIKAQA